MEDNLLSSAQIETVYYAMASFNNPRLENGKDSMRYKAILHICASLQTTQENPANHLIYKLRTARCVKGPTLQIILPLQKCLWHDAFSSTFQRTCMHSKWFCMQFPRFVLPSRRVLSIRRFPMLLKCRRGDIIDGDTLASWASLLSGSSAANPDNYWWFTGARTGFLLGDGIPPTTRNYAC